MLAAALRTITILALVAAGSAAAAEPVPGGPVARSLAIGETAPAITFKDIRWLPRQLSEFGERRAFVLVFITRECPVAKRFVPVVVELEAAFRDQGVQFAFVNAGALETIADAATQMVEAGVPFPLLKDFDLAAARALGVTRTPQAVVLDGTLKLRYRGRIDDRHRLTGGRGTPSREDLRRAIEDVLAGRAVEVAETPVDGCALSAEPAVEAKPELTWARDVAPIVLARCAECHRPRGEAPFPLTEYEHLAKRLAMVDEVVRERRMPPWYGSADYGTFRNHRSLSAAELATLRSWIKGGAAPGDLALAPPPPPPAPEWKIGAPDFVLIQLGAQEVPAAGIVPYQYVVMPHVFLEDTYVEAVEIRADNKPVLHHANLAVFRLGEKYKAENFITGYVPGGDPMRLGPGVAVKIPAGSVLGLQAHYVTAGRKEACRISVGLRYPRAPIAKLLRHHQITNTKFEIPPHAQGHVVAGKKTFAPAITGVGMFAHMHLRGRDMTFRAVAADGTEQTLLIVPNYNFDWQQSYHWPEEGVKFAPGTRIEVTAHFDNSRFNPFNPDPSSPVRFGLQTHEEMMYGFFFYTVDDERLDLVVDPSDGQVRGS